MNINRFYVCVYVCAYHLLETFQKLSAYCMSAMSNQVVIFYPKLHSVAQTNTKSKLIHIDIRYTQSTVQRYIVFMILLTMTMKIIIL